MKNKWLSINQNTEREKNNFNKSNMKDISTMDIQFNHNVL